MKRRDGGKWRWAARGLWAAWSAAALSLGVCTSARAGGGGENVAVVVNADSWASLTVANEYIHLRKIPSGNVVYLNLRTLGSFEGATVEQFRGKILKPVLDALGQRGLAHQIDCIAYSADVPFLINIEADKKGRTFSRPDKQVGSRGSLTGLTYLYGLVFTKDASKYTSLGTNFYTRPPIRAPGGGITVGSSRAFRAQYGWTPAGERTDPGRAMRYLLSTMLAVTSGRGNSVREALTSLRRSVSADGSRPTGTIYYTLNDDIRTLKRRPYFAPAAAILNGMGVKAEVIPTTLPNGRKDVAGLMIGAPAFRWGPSGSAILPGAICEHLTSSGGILVSHAGQTPLTDFIAAGAAGASGTVTEPFAIPAKFPLPFMHVHYARGCSLAEAFYQSVQGPYQLLIVGDPLCRPWAKIPRVALDGLAPGATVKGKIAIRPRPAGPPGVRVGRFELFLDGRHYASAPPAGPIELKSSGLPDGYHELRIVAVAADAIETRGRVIVPFHVNNHGLKLSIEPPAPALAQWGRPLRIAAKAPGARKIVFLHNSRQIGQIAGAGGAVTIDPQSLGQGPVRILPVAEIWPKGEKAPTFVAATPIELDVRPPIPWPALKIADPRELKKCVSVTLADGKKVTFEKPQRSWLRQAGVRKGESFTVQGHFQVPDDDVYQFQLYPRRGVSIRVDGKPLALSGRRGWAFVPVSLAKGWHRVEIRGGAGTGTALDVRFGGHGARGIEERFHHVATPGERVIAGGK